jgi:hypothetical protein
MLGVALSCRVAVDGGVFLRDAKPQGLDISWSVDRLDTCVTEFLHGAYCFYQCTFTLWRSPCGVYVCFPGQATTSDSDETDPNTLVYVVRCTWAPAVTSYLIRQ